MRKALLLSMSILCVMVVTSISAQTGNWSDFAAEGFEGNGVGDQENPYVIKTAAQLAYLAQQVNDDGDFSTGKYFKIDDSVSEIDLGAHDWTPIGTDYFFTGTFDGNGKTIKNLTITENNESFNRGLFSRINGATIKNLILEDVSIESYKTPSNNYTYTTGAVAGNSSTSAITNCHVSGEVIGTGRTYTGGLIGYLITGEMSLCSNSATVSVGTDSEIQIHHIGGLAGASSGKIDCCFNQGIVTGKNIKVLNIGGLVGNASGTNSEISNSYNVGNIEVETASTAAGVFTGGIAGNFSGVDKGIAYCYSYADITGGTSDDSATGGLIGVYDSGTIRYNLASSQNLKGNDDNTNTYSLIGKIETGKDSNGIQKNYAWLKGKEDNYYNIEETKSKTGSLWTGSMSSAPLVDEENSWPTQYWVIDSSDRLMPKLASEEILVKQPNTPNPLKSSETPSPTYHTITLEVAPGIDLYGMTAGNHQVVENGHLFLQFLPEEATATAADILFLVDGIETEFNVFAEGHYFSYILNPISQDHSILIAMKEYAVTLTETQGVTYNIGAGVHPVGYGEKFTFNLTLAEDIDPANVHVFANGTEIQADELRATILSYTIDRVIGPIVVVIEGTGDVTSNASLTHDIRVTVESGKLKVESDKAVDVQVYTISGQNVASLRGLSGSKTINLSAGVYIVRTGTQTTKVVVH